MLQLPHLRGSMMSPCLIDSIYFVGSRSYTKRDVDRAATGELIRIMAQESVHVDLHSTPVALQRVEVGRQHALPRT